MTSPQQRKGRSAELAVVRHLAEHHFPEAERRALLAGGTGPNATKDHGDVAGILGVCIEIKSYLDLARAIREGLTEAETEARGDELPVAVARRRNRKPGDWYAVVRLDDLCKLIKETQNDSRP